MKPTSENGQYLRPCGSQCTRGQDHAGRRSIKSVLWYKTHTELWSTVDSVKRSRAYCGRSHGRASTNRTSQTEVGASWEWDRCYVTGNTPTSRGNLGGEIHKSGSCEIRTSRCFQKLGFLSSSIFEKHDVPEVGLFEVMWWSMGSISGNAITECVLNFFLKTSCVMCLRYVSFCEW